MKRFIKLCFFGMLALLYINVNAQTPTVPSRYTISKLASGGLFEDEILDGIVADPISGNLYVATVSNVYSSSFKLYKIVPSGTVSYINSYNFSHTEIVKMAFSNADGHIYTLDGSGNVQKINPNTGTSSVFASGVGNGGRYGLNFDANGNLILAFESIFDFYKVTSTGVTHLGNVSASVPNGNHGDAFGIQPDGNYVVYTDCGGENNYAINTAGHTDGTSYTNLAWTSPTNIFTSLMPGGCGYSNGAIDPNTGEVYSTIANFGNGNSRILYTPEDGGETTLFVDSASAIMDLCFGAETSGGGCNSLFFIDRTLNAVFEVPMKNCCLPSPGLLTSTGGGTFCGSTKISANGGASGTIYFQGTTSRGTSTSDTSSTQNITSSGTYFFRAQHDSGCWGKQTAVTVVIKPLPSEPIIRPITDLSDCNGGNTSIQLFIDKTSFSDPITYNISAAELVNLPGNCGSSGDSRYGSGDVGFTWIDTGVGLVASVQIKLSVGIECNTGVHTTKFNNVAAPNFTTTSGWCSCDDPTSEQIHTINFNPTSYNIGGANTFLMSANTFGLFPASSLSNSYAQITVTYKSPEVVWSPGAVTTDTITVSPSTTTEYTVSITGGNGCSASASKIISVGSTVINSVSSKLNPSYAGCQSCTELEVNASGTGKLTYNWSTDVSLDTGRAIKVCPTSTTTYKVVATDNASCADTALFTQNVIDARHPLAGRVYMCQYQTSRRQWYTVSPYTTQITQMLAAGSKCGACNFSKKRIGDISFEGIDDIYSIFPNPAQNQITVESYNLNSEEVTIELVDMTGRVVLKIFNGFVMEGEYSQVTADISSLPNGIYFMRYSSASDLRVNKVQVVR